MALPQSRLQLLQKVFSLHTSAGYRVQPFHVPALRCPCGITRRPARMPASHFVFLTSSLKPGFSSNNLSYCVCLCVDDVWGLLWSTHVWHMCADQGTPLWSRFSSSSFTWVLGVEVRSPGLYSKATTHRAIPPPTPKPSKA